MIELVLAATATAFATGLGAIPVAILGARAEALRPALLGLAAGVMTVASLVGLLAPALNDGSLGEVALGVALGVGFLTAARLGLARHERTHPLGSRSLRTSLLVFTVLLVHSLPEGFAIGTAYASETAGLGLFVVIAIAVQNIPEGTSVAIPLEAAGFSGARQFWAAVATSIPQPIGAVVAYLLVEEISALLALSFGFAAGAMLALVAVELAPQAWRSDRRGALAGALLGAAAMLLLDLALGV